VVPSERTLRAARQFEGLLMGLMLQAMRRTVQPSGLLGGAASTRSTLDYLLDQAVVDHAVSAGRGWGLADRLAQAWASSGGKNAGAH
jgi:Rod binding domain-containing protein